ncbi:MAG: plasmid pRiA4b ORF-3 family protein [Candidatus Bathyarchaeota archaeon]|nr:plasmid pRiA4b ORF-3 family protein [Candidatus Termiticorpusculum sp.]
MGDNTSMSGSAVGVMQFVAELHEFRPTIWRRFQVRSDVDLADFCYVLMEMFHMGGHLFDFTINDVRYALPLPNVLGDWGEPAKNIKGITINELFTQEGTFGELWYDFGDSWYVGVKLESLKVTDPGSFEELPRVIEGEGFGIVENCGGVEGLEEIAKGLKTGRGADWKDQKAWLKENYPEVLEKGLTHFDLDQINTAIKHCHVADIYKLMTK